jgi:hypothetical protein
MRPGLLLACLILTGCSAAPVTEQALVPSPSPTLSVLGEKLAAPTPEVRHAPTMSPTVPKAVQLAPRPKPVVHYVKPKPQPGTCTVGQPCSLTGLAWHKTVGCTLAWRKATGRPCPPGWPPIP